MGDRGLEDPLKEGMAIHCNILAWRIPRDRGAWQAIVHGVTELDTTHVTQQRGLMEIFGIPRCEIMLCIISALFTLGNVFNQIRASI